MASILIPSSIGIAQLLISGAAGSYILNNIGKLIPGYVTPPKTTATVDGSLSTLIAHAKADIAAEVAAGKDTQANADIACAMLDKLPEVLAKV